MKQTENYPRAFSHIGITVPDIKKSRKILRRSNGLVCNYATFNHKKEADTTIGIMCIDVFGKDWETFEIAHIATSDGIGVELFSFPHGKKEAPDFNPFNTGLFHFCVQDPNIEELTKKKSRKRWQITYANSHLLSQRKTLPNGVCRSPF